MPPVMGWGGVAGGGLRALGFQPSLLILLRRLHPGALGSGCLKVKAELPFGASLLSCLEVPGTLGRVSLEAGSSPSHGLRQAGN